MGKLTGKLLQKPRDLRRRGHASPLREGSALQVGTRAAFIPAKAVGSFVPKLTQKAFEKYGFSAAALLTDWALIAGGDVAACTVPERLKWPRGVGDRAEIDEGGEGRPGATLLLRVDPARALDIEYRRQQIVERINAYFGYRAVAELRLIQAPIEQPAASERGKIASAPAASSVAEESDPLARALARLGAAVMGRAQGPGRAC